MLLKIIIVLFACSALCFAGTYTAATCNRADVNAVINGPTHTAVDGDIINIPAGSCTWTSGVTVPSAIGITIAGSGTPNSTAATTGASSSCATSTTITISGAFTAFSFSPQYGSSTARLSCMNISYSSGAAAAMKALGTCTASGCPNLRMDNITFSNWAGHTSAGISYAINAVGNVFGVMDHNTINGVTNTYLQLTQIAHANYLGTGSYGDYSWNQAETFGGTNNLYIENNQFNTAGCCENEGSAGGLTNEGGGRLVVRFNTFANMDNPNFSMGWHGTESNGRPRSVREWEYYGNNWTCASHCDSVAGARGGTGLTWGNTINMVGASINSYFTLTTYRASASIGGWGACDGSSAYDINDGTTYYSGTIGSVSTNPTTGAATIIVSGGSPGWTTNQWSPVGAPYSVHDVTRSNGAEITANNANSLTTTANTGGPGSWLPVAGDSIQILRATACIDQAGGRGAGILYNPTDPATPASSSSEVASPTYQWLSTFSGGTPAFNSTYGIGSNTGRVIRNRDYYVEQINQAAQTTSSSPFDGTTTIGFGHGTLALRPTTCTTGVAYWATDQGNWNFSGGGQGQLYVCTATNTWSLYYTPYTYPHPIAYPLSLPGMVIVGPFQAQGLTVIR